MDSLLPLLPPFDTCGNMFAMGEDLLQLSVSFLPNLSLLEFDVIVFWVCVAIREVCGFLAFLQSLEPGEQALGQQRFQLGKGEARDLVSFHERRC